ncbi:hypothetical protein AB0K93_17375 [Streptomyces sp. NPDC052676]|uniref:hypothetical protein n=1 Tax=Streptomyces sp. NPDC052676 TaxID=3154953 RepID=UPI00342A7A39
MPRGRHRHSPPLHRLLPPSAIAGVSLVCALGPWVFEEPMVLRGLAAAAAVTAVVGAVVMRRWDTQAGKRVADLTRARASDEWRFEERVAELEADLDESRELRQKLEQRLRAKRAELAGLRNEHAALLRRYATAETERASALEGRRLLELEAATPARALPAAAEPEQSRPVRDEAESAAEEKPGLPALFSPDGARLFQRAGAALARLDADTKAKAEASAPDGGSDASGAGAPEVAAAAVAAAAGAVPAAVAESGGTPETDSEPRDSVRGGGKPAPSGTASVPRQAAKGGAEGSGAERSGAERSGAERSGAERAGAERVGAEGSGAEGAGAERAGAERAGAERAAAGAEAAREDEARGKPEAVAGQEHSAAASPDGQPAPQQPAGHFTVPTAVAVVPPTPARRPATEGGFDFFGTKSKGNAAALEAVQNEDLADVVGQEALDLHKAETEGGFRPPTPAAAEQAAGQVIDLTAHDETERIDVQDLRTAAS